MCGYQTKLETKHMTLIIEIPTDMHIMFSEQSDKAHVQLTEIWIGQSLLFPAVVMRV